MAGTTARGPQVTAASAAALKDIKVTFQNQVDPNYAKARADDEPTPVCKPTPEKDKFSGEYEFGGTVGNIAVMIFSHVVPYYLWICVELYGGSMVYPGHPAVAAQTAKFGGSSSLWTQVSTYMAAHAAPTAFTLAVFSGFLFFEWFLAAIMPGVKTTGLPVPSENNFKYTYKCNALLGWYTLLASIAGLHFSGILPLQIWRDNYGSFITAAILWADALSVIIFAYGVLSGWATRMSGNLVHDFFMGSLLNPRLPGNVDLKLFAEIRNSWSLLFMLGLSCAAKMHEETGAVSTNMLLLLGLYFLYANACQKGEECIPTSWDIHHEKFGWMLIYWNFAGVPFAYASIGLYLQTHVKLAPQYQWTGLPLAAFVFVMLGAYYVFDTANAQKNRFRMRRVGVDMTIIRRKTFPQLPWAFIEKPRTLVGPGGKELLIDGWFAYGRKIHYTADIMQAFLWGSTCGWDGALLPFFYFCFFLGMIIHREQRDFVKCQRKYGPMWDRYVAIVPNAFIPNILADRKKAE
jgi:delta24(24(1))-sterol reductase